MRNSLSFIICFFTLTVFSQNGNGDVVENISQEALANRSSGSDEAYDVFIPQGSPFSTGTNIEGDIQNSVNLSTGKVVFSVPLASVNAKGVSFPVSFLYNGDNAFRQGSELNKFTPTSTIGVGWSLNIPRIVSDHKNTGAIDDDTFYLVTNGSAIKLLNIGWDFDHYEYRPEVYSPIKIFYYSFHDSDRWVITDENGITYIYDKRSYLSTWRDGNWIGNTRTAPSGQYTIEWKLGKMEDQWQNNEIYFLYDEIMEKNNSSQPGHADHTEASYIKEINSSRGGKIIFNYGDKLPEEYFEPHPEATEPDAYQEQYEKRYINNIDIYNGNNTFKYRYALTYDIQSLDSNNKKRYLVGITEQSATSQSLPPQEFEYFLNEPYKGGLKKRIFPSGGSVSYIYDNNTVLNNNNNRFVSTPPDLSQDYYFSGAYAGDNYALKIYMSKTLYSGNKRKFMVVRFWWDGMNWEHNLYDFGSYGKELFQMDDESDQAPNNMQAVFGDDFYGIIRHHGDDTDLHLFHLNRDGHTWNSFVQYDIDTGSGRPTFMSGDNFASIGSERSGKIYNYFWGGDDWKYKMINQTGGHYYYSAANNFIMSFDEDGDAGNSVDYITGNLHSDYYYFHYLNLEQSWSSLSWSSILDPYFLGIVGTGYFFPGSTMATFVADNNPEKIIMWNKYYFISNVESPFGWYDDNSPVYSTFNNNFTISNYFKNPQKTVRYNGNTWNIQEISPSFGTILSEDLVLTHENSGQNRFYFWKYSPNADAWSKYYLNQYFPDFYTKSIAGISKYFGIVGDKLYSRATTGLLNNPINADLYGLKSNFIFANNSNEIFAEFVNSSGNFLHSRFFYLNKKSGAVENSLSKKHLEGMESGIFGGWHPFISNSSLWTRSYTGTNSFYSYLNRIIDGNINNLISDKVVNKIVIDNNDGDVREFEYTYSDAHASIDNANVYYGEVGVKNLGHGLGNIGFVKNFYNNGKEDIRFAGILEKQEVRDFEDNLLNEKLNSWELFYTNTVPNGQFHVGSAYYLRLMSTTEREYFDQNYIENSKTYTYNDLGLQTNLSFTNSQGLTENIQTNYAYLEYSFLRDKNLVTVPYEVKKRINGEVVSINRNIWEQNASDLTVYPYEEWIKQYDANYRKVSQISKVDENGNILETNNLEGFYNTTLYGKNHKYPIAQIQNATFNQVINELNITYTQLQSNTVNIKSELLVLYDRLPHAMINITLFNDEGQIVTKLDTRKNEINYFYDEFGRLEKTTDKNGNLLEEKEYKYRNE